MIPMRENSEVVIIYTDKYANTATVYPPMVTHGNNWILGLFPAGHFLEITTAGNESNLRKIILRYLIMSCPMENHPFRKMILPYVLQKKIGNCQLATSVMWLGNSIRSSEPLLVFGYACP